MNQQISLVIDAWIREAQEASKLVEDLESRSIKNEEAALAHELSLKDIAKSKLFEVGIKLDRLESLLHNPPSKPILTEEDLGFRWKMLLDLRLRTRSLALSLYASPSAKRIGGLSAANTKETSKTTNSHDLEKMKTLFSKDDPELLEPLLSDDTYRSRVQVKRSGSSISMNLLRKVCWTICFILGASVLIFILVILCAII